jgi:hypothetical protein
MLMSSKLFCPYTVFIVTFILYKVYTSDAFRHLRRLVAVTFES